MTQKIKTEFTDADEALEWAEKEGHYVIMTQQDMGPEGCGPVTLIVTGDKR